MDWLVVGLGNPGREYEGTRHNIGFRVAAALVERWGLGRASERFRGRIAEGRVGATGRGGVRIAVLCPQTFYNDAGRSVGPARGSLKLALERVLVIHDEIDLPFGEVRTRLGGGLAGNNGLKSIRRELGGPDFMRVRVGVGRPDSTDPEIVSAHVLGRFRESQAEVAELIERACEHVERAVLGEGESPGPGVGAGDGPGSGLGSGSGPGSGLGSGPGAGDATSGRARRGGADGTETAGR